MELAVHQKNGLELAGQASEVTGRSFLATVELRSIETDLDEVFFGKGKLVADV